jgi:DNA-directed RNA polymerase beta subunit
MGEVDENILASAKQIPKANTTGTIVDMKVYFTVPLEELTESLNTFILKWAKNVKGNIKFEKQYQVDDIELEKRLKITKPSQTGTTSRINGAIIPNNGKGVLIEYYIKHDTTMSVGDKATLYANLKAIIAQIIPNGQEPITEDGIVLDGCLSLISVMARMCYSILMGGVITHALVEKSKSIAKEYLESI